jgi:two-component system, chemotaxis family, chemotaxis protein CheY
MRILIVDDSKAMRSIVRRTMAQIGFADHAFEEACNGAEALTLIRQSPPGLAIVDWNMPQMSGIELLKALRQEGSTLKFGFVTSEGTPEMKQEALAAGAAFFLSKPFSNEMLREVLLPVLSG